MFGNMGVHVIQFPSGKFGFVGTVPLPLAYECSDPKYAETARRFGERFGKGEAEREGGTFRRRVFETEAEARAAARDLGVEVK